MVDIPTDEAPRWGPREGSLLRVHARWILMVTTLTVVTACVLSWAAFEPRYQSEVRVLVEPDTRGGTPLMPDMETEQQVVRSDAIASVAARVAEASAAQLQRGLTVTTPADTTVLVIRYADTTADAAQRRAQVVADAYLAYRGGQATVLDTADRPRSTTRPNYLANGVAGLALGLLLGLGSALLRDRLDDGIRGPRDLADRTGLPVLATVHVSAGAGGARLPVLDAPDSATAEAYRHVRGKVARAARSEGRTPTVTLVTSAAWDDGALDVAVNTAAALALAGDTVLLMEGDLRAPQLAGLFGVPGDHGLGGVLAGSLSLREAMRASGVDRLWLLPAGADAPSAPGRSFHERAVEKLLGEIPAEVHHVIVQAPPILGAAETGILAERAHQLLIVAATGVTTRRDLGAALAELGAGRARVVGAVLYEEAASRRGPNRPLGGDDDTPSAGTAPADLTPTGYSDDERRVTDVPAQSPDRAG